MKTLGLVFLCAGLTASLSAQVFRPAAVSGAATGAVVGAIIGNNSGSLHHNAWKGAAIGAGAGLLLGAAIDDSRSHGPWGRTYAPAPRPVYVARYTPYHYGWAPRHVGHGHYYGGAWLPLGAAYTSYGYYGDYVWPTTLLGGIAGAIIGHNSGHHNAWRGAAIGAGAGLVLGSIAESAAREREAAAAAQAWASRPAAEATVSNNQAPQNVTIINNYYNQTPATPMASANAMFGRQ